VPRLCDRAGLFPGIVLLETLISRIRNLSTEDGFPGWRIADVGGSFLIRLLNLKSNIMEKTLSNSEKFFALYWSQYVAKTSGYNDLKTVSDIVYKNNGMSNISCIEYLELKSLSSISNEDAVE